MAWRDGRRTAALLGLSVFWSLLLCVPALAHAELEKTFPEEGETLSEQPGEVRLDFDEPVRAEFEPIKVTNESGERVDGDDARTLSDDPDIVVASLPDRPEGSYPVEWRVTSADGDPVGEQFEFAVGDSAAEAAAQDEDPAAKQDEDAAGGSLSLGVVLSVLLVGGLAVAGFLVLRRR
jgi:methionine-rich copper-binding protein CopC